MELIGQTHINPATGRPRYYKDTKATHDVNNSERMWVGKEYVSKQHPLHKPGRYKNWDDAHSHKRLDTMDGGEVYAIYNPAWPNWFKIGMAVDAQDRLSSYQTSCPYRSYELLTSVETGNRRKLELKAHELFETEATERRGEWFRLTRTQVTKLMKQLHECNEWT